MGLWTLVDAGIGGGGAGLTNPLADDESLVFGTTSPSSITALTTGVSPYTVLTTPTDPSTLVITTEANKTYDFFNIALAGLVQDPFILITGKNAARNEFGTIHYDPVTRSFALETSEGDDIDGTARNANGSQFVIRPGDGGTLGGHGGGVLYQIGRASAAAGVWNSGNHIFELRNGSGGGSQTKFTTTGDGVDIIWQPNGSYFRVQESATNHYLRFQHNATNAIYDTDTGGHFFNQKIDVTGTGRISSFTGIGVAAGIGTLFRVGSLAQDGAGVRASVGYDDTATSGTRISFDGRIRVADVFSNSSATYIAGNFASITPAALNVDLTGGLVGVQAFAICDMFGPRPVAKLWGSYSGASSTGAGTVAQACGGVDEVLNGTGALTDVKTRWIKPISNGGGAITTATSLYLESPSTGTTQWNLAAVGSAKSKFENWLSVNTTSAPTSPLQVVSLPVYANNAAAVGAGLTAGAFYRTGADPDPVCVVH